MIRWIGFLIFSIAAIAATIGIYRITKLGQQEQLPGLWICIAFIWVGILIINLAN